MKVKVAAPMLTWPLTVTDTLTGPGPATGAVTVSDVAEAAVTVPTPAPPNVTVLSLGVVLKPAPEIVTTWPAGPEFGEIEVTVGTTTKSLPSVGMVIG